MSFISGRGWLSDIKRIWLLIMFMSVVSGCDGGWIVGNVELDKI